MEIITTKKGSSEFFFSKQMEAFQGITVLCCFCILNFPNTFKTNGNCANISVQWYEKSTTNISIHIATHNNKTKGFEQKIP